jgi:8-oxo-dGTP pyrophosphatase MutT (NUDIX family)
VAGITRLKEVIAYPSDFGTLYHDEVAGPSGERSRYLRWHWKQPGVVIVPRRNGLVALCWMYRYPVHAASLEFPRGMLDEGETPEEGAARELREETGLVAQTLQRLGALHPDTGLQDHVNYIIEAVVDHEEERAAEVMESIDRAIVWKSVPEVYAAAQCGEIRCGTTLSALALLAPVGGDDG